MEPNISDWNVWIRRPDSTIYETYKYLSISLRRNDVVYKAISWIAERIRGAKRGGAPEAGELDVIAGMLGCRSVTLSGCARELLLLYHGKSPAEVEQRLLNALECGECGVKKDAIEVLLKAGKADALPAVLGTLASFERGQRSCMVRDAEGLAKEKPKEVDLAGVREALRRQADILAKAGEGGAAEEMRSHFMRIRKAMAEGGVCDGKRWGGAKADGRRRALIRKAC